MLKLNLGSSDDLRNGYLNVDVCDPPAGATAENFLMWDLSGQRFERVGFQPPEPWPWPDSSVDEIVAKDVFEHIENLWWRGQAGITWCLNEAHRVLKPGGWLNLTVPCLDNEGKGLGPWCDPSHVSVWCKDLRYYYDERWNNPDGERGRLGPSPAYGPITALFKTLPGGRSGVDWTPIQYAGPKVARHKLFVYLEAVK